MTMMVEPTPEGYVQLTGYTHGTGGLKKGSCFFTIRRVGHTFNYTLGTEGPVTPTELCACWRVYERMNAYYFEKGEKEVYGVVIMTVDRP